MIEALVADRAHERLGEAHPMEPQKLEEAPDGAVDRHMWFLREWEWEVPS